jgi:Outer membrane protein beta-barrel domain
MRHYLFVALFLISVLALGDDSFYNYGVEGGVDLSNISSDTGVSENIRLGLVAGLYWEFFPTGPVTWIPGGFIVGKGYKETPNSAVVLNYLQLRNLGRISLFRTSRARLYLDAGITADIITQKGTQNYSNPPQLSNFRNFDSSLLGGLGFEFEASEGTKVAFNLKYHYGLLNVLMDNSATIHSYGILFTTAIQFTTEKEKVVSTEERAREYIERNRKP